MSVIDSALEQVKRLQPYTPGKPVEELERELGIVNAIKLASNENPLGYSEKAKKAIQNASQNIELYPDANAFYLKRELAQKLGVETDQITIGNGSNDVLPRCRHQRFVACELVKQVCLADTESGHQAGQLRAFELPVGSMLAQLLVQLEGQI